MKLVYCELPTIGFVLLYFTNIKGPKRERESLREEERKRKRERFAKRQKWFKLNLHKFQTLKALQSNNGNHLKIMAINTNVFHIR